MKAYQQLPEGYGEILKIDLQEDKKTALKVNVGGGIVMVLMFLIGNFIVPMREFHNESVGRFFLRVFVILVGYTAYMVLHELTHAAVMKASGARQVRFGFTGLYAFAGSNEDYFDKISYRCTALAPLVVWGIIFGILTIVVPRDWFWVVWFLQAGNIGGAAGDVYVTARLWKMPETILVKDTGVNMTVFDR